MKLAKRIWNYLDMFIQLMLFLFSLLIVFFLCLNLEKFFYRYVIFPIFAMVVIFAMGILFGRNLERTRKFKPVGFFSKKMTESRKKQNAFIFKDDEETYIPKKRVIEEIKSGNINHIKQYNNQEFEYTENDFKDIYSVNIDDILDKEKVDLDLLDEDKKDTGKNDTIIQLGPGNDKENKE